MKRTFISRSRLLRNLVLYRAGYPRWKRRFTPRKSVIILGYHALDTPEFLKTSLGIGNRDGDFPRQMAYIARNHPVLSMADFLRGLAGDIAWPENAVMITFDDGYRDLLTTGLPVLESLGLPATVFITTDAIGTGRSLWTNRLYYHVSRSRLERITMDFGDIPKRFPLDSPVHRRESALRLSGLLKRMPAADRETMLNQIAVHLEVDPHGDPHDMLPMLDWDDTRRLRDAGITIGSHTRTHPILSRCDRATQHTEITGSKSRIESELETACMVLAYPNGQPDDYNDDTFVEVQSAGYQAAFTFFPGRIRPDCNPLAIPRHPIFEVPLHTFALSIC